MKPVKAIGFDLFNTLITADEGAVDEAVRRLIKTLHDSGLHFDDDEFMPLYRTTALNFIEKANANGKETHNRFWVSATLKKLGFSIEPYDPRISKALDRYFSAFFDYCHLVPGTRSMLKEIQARYSLGLLSNFTHAPACRELVNFFGLTEFFDPILVSGELGFRKPHTYVFNRLAKDLGVQREEMIYVGDNLEADIMGASRAGIKPVWFTYAKDKKVEMVPGEKWEIDQVPVPDNLTIVKNWDDFLEIVG